MSSLQSLILPLERQRWFQDQDGVMSTSKRDAEIIAVGLDFTDELASAETVASVALVNMGLTSASGILATPVYTLTVSGTGEAEVTATLSTGRKLQRVLRFYGEEGGATSDY